VLHAARCKYRTQKSRQKSLSGHHRTTSTGYIFANKACIDNCKKNLLSSNISSTCPHNMVNFGPLAAEIVSLVWGTPANFNGFGVLAALLWSPYGIGQTIIFSSCFFLLSFFFFFFFFSSPNIRGRILDVYHTSAHGVALVRI